MSKENRSVRLRFSLRTLFVVVTLAGVIVASWIGYRRWYVATHPFEVMVQKLHKSISPGDSVSDLERHFGPGYLMKLSEVPDHVLAATSPDGYQDGDQFVRWKVEKCRCTLYFQFRNGRLINHDPAHFANPEPIVGVWAP